jgi:CRISPR system Cascade subunit CasD
MTDFLLLRFDAPLMAFGGVLVDHRGFTMEHPGRSLVSGLLANAMGWDHADQERLQSLQERLRMASRCDRVGDRLTDFHTVDLGQDFLREGWTTRGAPEGRGGGSAKEGTHIRERHYHADRIQTIAVSLDGEGDPSIDALDRALMAPARPLFLGRKACLPSSPIRLGRIRADSAIAALQMAPRHWRAAHQRLAAWWPSDERGPEPNQLQPVYDERDWSSQVHVGRRLIRYGMIDPPAADGPRSPRCGGLP